MKGSVIMDWKARAKNPYFWAGLIGVILCAIGVDAETFTTWGAVADQLEALIKNPYMLCSVIVALVGYVINPTTKGLKD